MIFWGELGNWHVGRLGIGGLAPAPMSPYLRVSPSPQPPSSPAPSPLATPLQGNAELPNR